MILLIAFLVLVYIGWSNFSNRNKQKLVQMQQDLKELRWEYISAQADLQKVSQQTRIASAVDDFGIEELKEPPKTILLAKE